jgi:hypothetical protein
MSDEDKKGFTVTDRRMKAEEEKACDKDQKAKSDAQQPASEPLPEMTFASFLISLNTSALMHLGLLPDLATRQLEKNPELARQTIDLIGILKEKTRNNLSQEEEDLLNNLLYDLRLKFVDICK